MQLKSFVYSLLFILIFQSSNLRGQNERFNGLNMNMGNLYRLSNAETRSISPENFTGEKGKGWDGMGWGEYAHLNSLAVCVNPGSAFNCYWPMPFRKKCRITMENMSPLLPLTADSCR
jgi:hypothetical protein